MRNTAAVAGVKFETRQLILLTLFFYRYMNISDEWETPEKQPFKDFVSVINYPNMDIKKTAKILLAPLTLCVRLFREICVTGLRTPTVVTSTV